MRGPLTPHLPWICHWSHVEGPRDHGRATSLSMWICEYPYRTMRSEGPSEECEGCPVWEAMKARNRAAQADVDETEPTLPLSC
jgi:hypothetical protein